MTKRLSILLPVAGIIVLVIWMTAARPVTKGAPLAPPPVSPFRHVIAATGVIEAADRNYSLAPPTAGQIAAIYVKENDVVHRGDKLYLIDDREQRTLLDTAVANVAKAEAALARSRAGIQTQEASLASARAAVEVRKASYENFEQIAKRTNALYQAHLVSEEQYMSARKTSDVEKARWIQAIALEHQAEAQIAEAKAQLQQQEADVVAARAGRNQQAALLERLVVAEFWPSTSGLASMLVAHQPRLRLSSEPRIHCWFGRMSMK